jgi:hemolysin activation/secretion protein
MAIESRVPVDTYCLVGYTAINATPAALVTPASFLCSRRWSVDESRASRGNLRCGVSRICEFREDRRNVCCAVEAEYSMTGYLTSVSELSGPETSGVTGHRWLPRSRKGCATALVAAIAAVTPATNLFAGDVRTVREIRMEFAKPFGLPNFEEPARALAALEAASRDLLAAAKNEELDVLAPMPIRLLGSTAIAADAVAAPPEETAGGRSVPPPIEAGPLTMRKAGATGVFASVLVTFAERARLASQDETRALETREALRRFADLLRAEYEGRVALTGIDVTLSSVNGVLSAPGDAGSAPATMTLPAIAGFGGIDADGIAAVARQVELALEQTIAVQAADGNTAPLEFTVRATPATSAGDTTLRLLVAFVGPKAAPAVAVSSVSLSYVDGSGQPIADPAALGLPDPAMVLGSTTIALYREGEGDSAYLTDWNLGAPDVTASLAPDGLGPNTRLSISALRSVSEAVLGTLQANDLMGVYVDIAAGQFDMTRAGVDLRGGTELKLIAIPGIVDGVRVIASGERTEGNTAVDPPGRRYERIKERSPFGAEDPSGRVLRQSVLEEYLHRLSRHPNRRVDAAVTPPSTEAAAAASGSGPRGTIGLDYLVSENKPWSVFVQGSNTGTGSTGEWQQRFGIFHSDLFGNNEIASIEYLTTDFDAMHSVSGYFDGPVAESEVLRWKVYGGWYEYSASDVGLSSERFEGSSPSVGAELALNVFQHERLFVDVVGGVRWFDVKVNNLLFNFGGEQDFLVPYVGVRAQRNSRTATTDAAIFFDLCVADATDVDQVELNSLGRLLPERDWSIMRWDVAHSFYLDPLFVENASEGTLAHELAFRFRGQYSFDQRLIPQQLGVAGGFYTVRGYPESIVAGDTLVLASGEYRLHLPQLLGFDANPQPFLGIGEPFRLRPQFGYGATDWDLILRAFIDVGRVTNVDPFSFERNETLVGAGVGVQLQLWRNLDVRLDLGFPLNDLEGRDIDSHRLSFVGTLAF